MTQHSRDQHRHTSQRAESQPRWRWTLAQFERMIELGIIDTDDKVELIDGELVPMPAKEIAHETVRGDLLDWLVDHLPKHVRLRAELGWRADEATYCEPDFLIFRRGVKTVSRIKPAEVLLVIEVSDTALKKDLRTKSALYARLGVREYWVINALTLEAFVHRDPSADGYRSVQKVTKSKLLSAALVPEIALKLRGLGADSVETDG